MAFWDKVKKLFGIEPPAAAPAPPAPPAHPLARPLRFVQAPDPEPARIAVPNYLDAIRSDNLLDGLIGTSVGFTGGGWKNPITGHGTFGRDKVMQGRFEESFRIDDPQLSALYNGNDLAKKIIVTKPKEMLRRGFRLVVPQDIEEDDEDGQENYKAGANEQEPEGETGPAAPGAPLVDPMGAPPDNATAKDAGAAISGPATPAAAAGEDDPMGERTQKPTQPTPPTKVTTPITAKDDKKTAPPGGSQDKGADLAKAAGVYATRIGLLPRVFESLVFGRCFGGGNLIIGADDGQDMSEPLDETKIKTIRYLTWIDRRFQFASTWYTEIGPKFGEVETWEIVNPFGGQSNTHVHESRVIRFDGEPVDFLMRRRLLGWTLSVLQAPYDVMRQFDMSFQSVSNLMSDMSQAVMKMQGLAQMISNDQTTLNTRMQMVDISRSSARMLYLDAENEEFERTATPMTGVSDALQMFMLRMAAAADMPVAILFGREPSGLNATGDADFRRFYDTISGEQLTYLEPKLRRLFTLIFAAKDGPTRGKVPKQDLEFVWHKLYEPSEKEQSEIRLNMAQADNFYVQAQILLPEEVAVSRFRNGDLNLDTEIDIELRHEALEDAQLAPSGAEKAQQDQANKEAELKIQATSASAKGGPPKPGAKPPAARGDAWETGERFDSAADDVHEIMSEDYPEEAISWVHSAPWRGPVAVPLKQIDYRNRAKWQASQPEDAERVGQFKDAIEKGDYKPIILVQTPEGRAIIVDGHHRALAAFLRGDKTIKAYVAKVLKVRGPWDDTHDMQRERKSG